MIIPFSDDCGHGEEVVFEPRTTTLPTKHTLAAFCQQVGKITFEQEEERKEKDGGVCVVLETEKINLPGKTFATIGDGDDDKKDDDMIMTMSMAMTMTMRMTQMTMTMMMTQMTMVKMTMAMTMTMMMTMTKTVTMVILKGSSTKKNSIA